MTLAAFAIGAIILVGAPSLAQGSKTYVGVITDTMCAGDHAAMRVTPDAKCVKDCVRDGKAFQYALLDGSKVYRLSDQETPAEFAGRKVKVTGVLYTKTSILRVERIDASN